MAYEINTKYFEYFIKVAQLGSINKAARELFISQPYLGKIIRELEEEFGAVLLNRDSRGVSLTPDGERFLTRASNILKELDAMRRHGPGDESGGFERLSVSMTKFSHVMESFIEVVLRHRDQRAFTHRLLEGTLEDVVQDVFQERAEVGVLHFSHRRHDRVVQRLEEKGLSYQHLAHVRPHIILSQNHPLLLAHKPVSLRSLREYGFIQYLGQYDDLVSNLLDQDLLPDWSGHGKTVYLSSRSALMQMISMSDFYSIGIHSFGLQASRYQVLSVPMMERELMFEFGCVSLRSRPLSGIAREFVADIQQRLS